MESIWDILVWVLLISFVAIALTRLILHFICPVTWRDGEGPAVSEGNGTGNIPLFGYFGSFWGNLFHSLLP